MHNAVKYYTGIGSRNTPDGVYRAMVWIGYQMARNGVRLRSGGAVGADTAFSMGVMRWINGTGVEPLYHQEIFLPGHSFNNQTRSTPQGIFDATQLGNWDEALSIAATVHPVWDRLKPFVKALHARNTYQVLGPHLNNPSDLLVCWAPPTGNGQVKGGTNTAVTLAHRFGVPVYNLHIEGVYEQLIDDYQLGVIV